MKIGRFVFFITLLLLVVSGCQEAYKGNLTPKDFLGSSDADIFVLDSIVYSNAQDLEWLKELPYIVGEQVGEITKQTSKAWKFKSGTSNKLPVGTKIYKTDTLAYIVVVDGKEIPYVGMYEG
ncbi:hypothetical protein [Sporosarcina sp. BP05]|uniref:hypothetical protein n=1 Tax=Sporosarcina sp. BP05 TaxID=2758726 RepID=UPI00164621B0|nr:hypothetical protein [Sporosarcina sp. BP05]